MTNKTDGNMVFNPTHVQIGNLITMIDTGDIALPDLQRPFIWTKTKVRDLLDSLYKGLPVGVIILWKIAEPKQTGVKPINIGTKKEPTYLVIDGQQRLTALYSIIKNKPVIVKNVKKEKVKIAFNPIQEKFEVWNPAIEKNPEWISDVSEIFNNAAVFSFIKNYLKRNEEKDVLMDEDLIASRIEKVRAIQNYTFSVLELSSELDPEEVSEIFVRINSKGKQLTQSDFILTLMSVYWQEGRDILEKFCTESHILPTPGKPSPYNIINIHPTPENMIRAIIGFAFRRGKLKYAYLTLKGRDFENKVTTPELRGKNFNKFKDAQQKTLDLTNWHDFIKIVHSIGFANEKLVSSKVAFYTTYALYLIGKCDYGIDSLELEHLIKRYFAFSQITQRYSASPESTIEQDLNTLSDLNDFRAFIDNTIHTNMTKDFWEIRLPQDILKTSSTNSFAFSVYTAALCYFDTNVAFSDIKLRDYLNPFIKAKKNTIDLHHIFPKKYLEKINISTRREVNQIANMLYLEYKHNIKIGDKVPGDYWPDLLDGYSPDEVNTILRTYDLPQDFWNMKYSEFLEERRILMANKIRDYFNSL